MSFNTITVVGNLGRDPELRYTPAGDAVCNFSIATNKKKKDKNGDMQDVTTWFRVTLWRKTAELASKYLTKGSQVYIQGELSLSEYTPEGGGEKRTTLEIEGREMQFIGSGGERSNAAGAGGGSGDFDQSQESGGGFDTGGAPAPAPGDDDIPF